MWLLDTQTYRLHPVPDKPFPHYAILSHRWGEEEVSFADYRACQMIEDSVSSLTADEEQVLPALKEIRAQRMQKLKLKKGREKIERLCKKARAFGLDWAWLDTVCVDKSSSAELQEAINSMFKWYRGARMCFVYMNDVTADTVKESRTGTEQFKRSKWFTRSWTLQELLAPGTRYLLFLNESWDAIGSGNDLLDEISEITTIPTKDLAESPGGLRSRCIAQRMSWAAHRKATRAEDVAYSLMGLFDVNMTMMYGEGGVRAFQRLQEEIIKKSTDETILAWNNYDFREYAEHGHILAKRPKDFACAGKLKYIDDSHRPDKVKRGLEVIPRGILIETFLLDCFNTNYISKSEVKPEEWTAQYAVPLLCTDGSTGSPELTVFLQLSHWQDQEFIRTESTFVAQLDWEELRRCQTPRRICLRNIMFL